MRQALDLLQFLLWAEGFLCLVAAPALARMAWLNPESAWASWTTVYMAVLGLAAPYVAWGLSRRERWSRWAGLAHGVLQVPALPFFTPIGVIALVALAHPESRRHLDAEPLPPAPMRFSVWRAILHGLGLCWLVAAAWASAEYAASVQARVWPIAGLLLLAPLMGFVDLLAHETGHLLAGWAAGLQFERFCVGPLLVRRLGDGWGVSLHSALLLEGGFVSMTPVRERGLRGSLALLAIGGPLASLVLAVVALLGALANPAWCQPLMILAAWSFFTFLGNAWPMRAAGGVTDGALFLEIALATRSGRRYLALASMAMSEVTALRPRDWPRAWLDKARAVADGSPEHLAACLFEHWHWLDRGDTRRAGELLEEAASLERRMPEMLITGQMRLAQAWFEAVHRRSPERARDSFELGARGLPVEEYLVRRAEAAVLAVEGDGCCARGALDRAQRVLERSRACGWREFELDRLTETGSLLAESESHAGVCHHAASTH